MTLAAKCVYPSIPEVFLINAEKEDNARYYVVYQRKQDVG